MADNRTLQLVCQHADILESLWESPKYKRELANDRGISKSTVYNIHQKLKDRGFITKQDSKYHLTKRGAIAFIVYTGYNNQMKMIDDISTRKVGESNDV
ncbi:hypothetical protein CHINAEXTREME_06500 [Halobiforma lacisalsi AJ5]|uniref:HVO-A0261-like N-terminal domain-containing protein n=1 Tax=Natronobacterium lacisalsi AJ5 TaxID=358396 RepID=A0A1P8LNS2_NATLA|nr:helix-turn-helix domain-containing protein [Halobiforma lacisalsi]APW97440.1 hypothetical protein CHINAEXTREME_06500 [Halobiforma lacisalsi AJ5]